MSKENTRRKFHTDIECVQKGFANGVAENHPLNEEEKQAMIEEAALHYGKFLTALKCDWEKDPNSMETPKRVAKAYVNDLWAGRYNELSGVTSFPSDGNEVIGDIAVYLPAHKSFTYALATRLGVSIEFGSFLQSHFKASKNLP